MNGMWLAPEQIDELREALLDAFSPSELEQLLSSQLGMRLADVTRRGTFVEVVVDLVQHAEKRNYTPRLLDAALSARVGLVSTRWRM